MLIDIASAGNIQCLEAGETHTHTHTHTHIEREREREREREGEIMAPTLTHSRRKGTRVQLNLRYK